MNDFPQDRIEIEINAETTAKIDTLVEEGLYPDRLKFIETALQSQIGLHKATFEKYEKKKSFVIGYLTYSAKGLEKVVAEGKKLEIKVIGGLSIENNVSPELAEKAISKVSLAGILRAPPDVLPVLNSKRYSILGRPYSELFDDKKQRELPE
ncbi:MAG: hypothetical protein ACXAC7_06505 [Candidatus Hodarchaeales archaeon]|jgi:hypothetical protein